MATARNVLYVQLVTVLSTNTKESLRDRLTEVLSNFRIQHRPGIQAPIHVTARELFLNEILEKCTMIPASEIQRRLEGVFENYRMQKKGKDLENQKPTDVKSRKEGSTKAKKVKETSLVLPSSPVGGGPVRKINARGECPKCHSKGVVLAHSFSGDDYFSCIYCGFQAYGAPVDTDLDIPLATELLGRRFDERGEIETDESES